jgi:hypothetical protein
MSIDFASRSLADFLPSDHSCIGQSEHRRQISPFSRDEVTVSGRAICGIVNGGIGPCTSTAI